MKKEITISVYFTNQEMWTIRDVLFYSWEDDKFLSIETTRGKVSVTLANPSVEPETEIIRCHECRYNDGGYCSMLRERTKRNGVEVRIWSQFFCAYGEKEEKR